MYDGGPVFPVIRWDLNAVGEIAPCGSEPGMSLRDYFAAAALQGELAAQDARHEGKGTGVVTLDTAEEFTNRIWALADAMIASRYAK